MEMQSGWEKSRQLHDARRKKRNTRERLKVCQDESNRVRTEGASSAES
jgi:hypothetical protein